MSNHPLTYGYFCEYYKICVYFVMPMWSMFHLLMTSCMSMALLATLVCDNKHDRNNVGYSARANQREKIIIRCKCKHNRCKNQITILMWNLNSTTSLTMEDRTFLVKEDDDARIGREEGVLGRSDFSVIPFQAVTVLFKKDFSSCHCII